MCNIVALSHTFIKKLYTYVHYAIFVTMKRFDGPGENYENTIGVNMPMTKHLVCQLALNLNGCCLLCF